MSLSRYPTYKCSAILCLKELPEHWGVCPLKSLLSIENGLDHKEVVSDEGWPVFGSGGPFAQASNYLYDGETILLGRKGTIDKPLYYSGKFWAVDTMYWSKVKPGCVGRFVYFSCLSIPFSYYQTSTALPSMTKTSLGSHAVCLPPVDEQLAIAMFLDRETAKIDALIAEQQHLIELLQEKRQAVISHAVTKGLNPNAPMKDSGVEWLGEVPEHWEVGQMRRYIQKERKITYGIVQPGEPDPTGRFMVRGQDYSTGWSNPDSIFRVSPIIEEPYSRSRLKPGDLIMTIVGAGVGNTAKVPDWLDGANVTQTTCRIAVEAQTMNPDYMKLVLDSSVGRYSVGFYAKGAAQPGLNLEHVKVFPVTRPPLDEQVGITEYLKESLSGIDDLIQQSQTASTLLQERRSALISAAVTGQIDVRGLALEGAA